MTRGPKPVRLLWHADSYDRAIASIRLRLIQPSLHLSENGFEIIQSQNQIATSAVDGAIFSKSVGEDALGLAKSIQGAGGKIIYDLCDNYFEAKDSSRKTEITYVARTIMDMADHVIFSTPLLEEQIRAAIPSINGRTSIVPDMLDDLSLWPVTPNWRDRLNLMSHEHFLNRHYGALHCVWFGKSHGKKAGLLHLTKIEPLLYEYSKSHPVTLTVIGDRRKIYWRESWCWSLPHHYLPWSLNSFPVALGRHHVALIPLEQNGYTVGKTINRPATALLAGLGVIANAIDSYEELRPFIIFDNWISGLKHYSIMPPWQDPALKDAKDHLKLKFGPATIGKQWETTLLRVFTT